MQSSRQAGFTLLEVLLVILLMGLAASAVTLSINNAGPEKELERHARQFVATTELVLDEVVMSGQFVGLVVEDHSYEFVLRREGKWVPLEDGRMVSRREFEEPVELSLVVEGLPLVQEDEEETSWFDEPFEEADVGFTKKEKKLDPQVFLFPSGEMSGFELSFLGRDDNNKDIDVLVVANPLGRLTLGREDEYPAN
ncbi:type II secretion system minor pseudopilin GspH [Shewanella corallii]|uniref:Type II secretion system protein H n=2 Tax=Shewanella TaxID=22 RepID=A0ABT0NCF4_9GAMM|nr:MULTISPECIES: type II secretion system minor pseudopilin GspH [Shewanella]MCL1039577.1 type II secretion system minor pseudopilin GspH [Shewanella submarina]MCL2916168.1 type II secretion system minor pseudopilin GspH [Shewanella corallii]